MDKDKEKQSVAAVVDELLSALRRRQIEGSLQCAKRTAEIMRVLVTQQRHVDAAALIDDVRSIGYKIQAAKPSELAIGNIVRRVLHLIREEAQNEALAHQAELEEAQATASSTTAAAAEPSSRADVARAQAAGAATGLLSQAFKPGPGGAGRSAFASRTLSLSNLLDVGYHELSPGPGPAGEAAHPPSIQQQQHPTHAEPDVESQVSVARGAPGSKAARRPAVNWKHKHVIIDAINDLIDELENITTSITVQGVEHLHANEVILTQGLSDTTYAFLKEASKKREFQVVVAEGAPRYDGHQMGKRLAEAGIHATVIADSAVFAMMARANKVIVGAHAVMANGGVVAPCGMHMVALAARKFSIPFVVLVGLHKLSPLFPHQPEVGLNEFRSPGEVVGLDMVAAAFAAQAALDAARAASSLQGSAGAAQQAHPPQADDADPLAGTLHVPNPAFDYIPPELISLFITDAGGYTPSYVYRLLTEYYSREDYLLSKELLTGRGPQL